MIHFADSLKVNGLTGAEHRSGRVYRKQAAYVGGFGQHDASGKPIGARVNIDRDTIDHWCKSVREQVSAGIKIPVQKTHNPDSPVDEVVGHVIDAETATDEKGRYSLYLFCEFANQETADRYSTVADCSVYQPPTYSTGVEGLTFVRPIRHLMLTATPVVPDMSRFVSLSLEQAEGNKTMNFTALLALFGLAAVDNEQPETTIERIIAAGKALSEKVADLEAKVAAAVTPAVAMSISPIVANMATQLRSSKIDNLLAVGKITPAQAEKLKATFATPGNTVALSLNADGSAVDDTLFESVTAILSLSPAQVVTGRAMPNTGLPAGTSPALTRGEALDAMYRKRHAKQAAASN